MSIWPCEVKRREERCILGHRPSHLQDALGITKAQWCKCQSLLLLKSLAVKTSKKQWYLCWMSSFISFKCKVGKGGLKMSTVYTSAVTDRKKWAWDFSCSWQLPPTREMSLSHNAGQQKQISTVMIWSILVSCLLDVDNPPISTWHWFLCITFFLITVCALFWSHRKIVNKNVGTSAGRRCDVR